MYWNVNENDLKTSSLEIFFFFFFQINAIRNENEKNIVQWWSWIIHEYFSIQQFVLEGENVCSVFCIIRSFPTKTIK